MSIDFITGKSLQFEQPHNNKCCCKDREYFRKVATLIASIAIGIFIFPLFMPEYYSNIKKSFYAVKLHRFIQTSEPAVIEKTVTGPLSLEDVIKSVRTEKRHKNTSELFKLSVKVTDPMATDETLREKFIETVKEKHSNQTLIRRAMGPNTLYTQSGSSHHWSLYMPGLALIATYLKNKNNLRDLYVCDSLIAFQKKFKQIANSPNDERVALIVPRRPFNINKPDMWFQSQHKGTICVEKKSGKLKIVLFDSQPDKSTLDEIIHQPFEKAREGISGIGVPIWFMNHSGANLESAEIYISNVKRQNSYGCETFALRDAVSFLQNPNFFSNIEFSPDPDQACIKRIEALPVEFMKGVQSLKTLINYINRRPELASKQMKHKDSTWSLIACLNEHVINIEMMSKKQNHYISSRTYKYHLILMKALETMRTEDLVTCIRESLVEAPEDQFNTNSPYPQDDFQYLYSRGVT